MPGHNRTLMGYSKEQIWIRNEPARPGLRRHVPWFCGLHFHHENAPPAVRPPLPTAAHFLVSLNPTMTGSLLFLPDQQCVSPRNIQGKGGHGWTGGVNMSPEGGQPHRPSRVAPPVADPLQSELFLRRVLLLPFSGTIETGPRGALSWTELVIPG